MTSLALNHLLQSTLFAVVAGLLTLALKHNHARARYWLWLGASLKFLVPFALLTNLGSQLMPRVPILRTRLLVLVEEFGRQVVPAAGLPASSPHTFMSVPVVLSALWLAGFVCVLAAWGLKAWRLRTIVHSAIPLDMGSEAGTLRRIQRVAGLQQRVQLRSCASLLEPGVFGIFRPILLMPTGISDCLDQAQMEAVIAHELCHVRNRDNLHAAFQMLIESIFWFHPLVWWLGARQVEERERACDEEVLRMGSEPETYAESILKVCRFYLESPMMCVAGVTGADLSKRIECIMRRGTGRKLDLARKLLLGAAAITALAGPIALGGMHASTIEIERRAPRDTPISFRNVSIRRVEPRIHRVSIQSLPDGTFIAENASVKMLAGFAYNVRPHQIVGGPAWLDSERYDISATGEPGLFGEQVRFMVRKLLEDRFKLAVRHDVKELPMFDMTLANNRPKFHESRRDSRLEEHMFQVGPDHLRASSATMSDFAQILSGQLSRSVVDRTGLKGAYDLKVDWHGSSLAVAAREQLGLRLEPREGPVEILIVEHAEKLAAGKS